MTMSLCIIVKITKYQSFLYDNRQVSLFFHHTALCCMSAIAAYNLYVVVRESNAPLLVFKRSVTSNFASVRVPRTEIESVYSWSVSLPVGRRGHDHGEETSLFISLHHHLALLHDLAVVDDAIGVDAFGTRREVDGIFIAGSLSRVHSLAEQVDDLYKITFDAVEIKRTTRGIGVNMDAVSGIIDRDGRLSGLCMCCEAG